MIVLNALHTHEEDCPEDRQDDIYLEPLDITLLRISYRPCSRQAGENQYDRVGRAEGRIKIEMRPIKHLRVLSAIDSISAEETSKEKNLSDKKEPNTHLARLKMLVGFVKVMRRVGIGGFAMPMPVVAASC
jgi:hypothetical protein